MAQIAKLIEVSLITRVIVEETASEHDILNAARSGFIDKIENDLEDNIKSIDNDLECPYDPEYDKPGK